MIGLRLHSKPIFIMRLNVIMRLFISRIVITRFRCTFKKYFVSYISKFVI